MTNEKLLRRPFFLGLTLVLSALLIGAANVPATAQDAPAAQPEATAAVEPAADAAAQPAETAVEAAAEPVAETATEEAEAANPITATEPVVEEVVDELDANSNAGSYLVFGSFALVVILGIFLARFLSKKFRLPEFQTGYFIIFFCFVGATISTILGLAQHRVNLGVDLRGGSILVYSVTPTQLEGDAATEEADPNAAAKSITNDQMNALKNALSKRINPSGVREISIQELGANSEIKITIPEADDAEVARLERVINSAGQLKFRILASTTSSDEQEKAVVELAQKPEFANEWKLSLDDAARAGGIVKGATWVPVDPTQGDLIQPDNVVRPSQLKVREEEKDAQPQFDVLVLELIEEYDVVGGHMANVQESIGQMGEPEVVFTMRQIGAERMQLLTDRYKAGTDRAQGRQLGVVLNDRVYSAPNIKSAIGARGSITFGNNLTAEDRARIQTEVADLIAVMNAGVLPATLSEKPVTKMITGPTLGADTIAKGTNAVIWGGAVVLLFMIAYYGFGGLIATFAVLMNLVMIMSAMIAMRAAFTLPGLAGLVLTVGMAVDANILIFERIREELNGGAALRMAVRNGYQRAFTAIFDSNITTMLTAWILYLVGSEQIKSFAVTLFLGVLFSMFTATYVCRIIFQTCEKAGWLSKRCVMPILPGMKPLGRPNFDFFRLCKQTYKISVGIIIIGMIALVIRGKGIFDVDFVGGVEIQTVFTEPVEISEIRSNLSELPDLSVGALTLAKDRDGNAVQENTCYTISASCPTDKTADQFRDEVEELLKTKFEGKLRHYEASYEVGASLQTLPAGATVEITQTPVVVTLNPALGREVVQGFFEDQNAKDETALKFEVTNDEYAAGSNEPSTRWEVVFNSDDAEAIKALADKATAAIAAQSAFEASNTVGSSVAGYARVQGILAILGSLLCIIAYLWFRFKRAVYGLSAVVGLIHDVLFTLGVLAMSYWLAPFLGFLGITQFKIGLATIAAFLTLIGYSLNDTIILFDRMREIRGKSEALTKEIINKAINQTLSRTILTSLTTFFTAIVLYAFGGAGIHTFAFAMCVGLVVGTYSSIFICAPFLYWLLQKQASKTPSARVK